MPGGVGGVGGGAVGEVAATRLRLNEPSVTIVTDQREQACSFLNDGVFVGGELSRQDRARVRSNKHLETQVARHHRAHLVRQKYRDRGCEFMSVRAVLHGRDYR